MGCGESKLAVATSNTILRRKKSNVDGDQSSKKSKDIETVEKANTTAINANRANSPVQQLEDQKKSEEVKEDNINNNSIVNVKDINVNKDGDKDNKEGDQNDAAGERLISQGSPNRFFSLRKLDEEGIDGIISEGRSGTSDYFTPRHERNLQFKLDDDIAEDAQELDNQNLALPAETKGPGTEKNEEPVKSVEILVKEKVAVATSTNVEDKVSSPAEEGKK